MKVQTAGPLEALKALGLQNLGHVFWDLPVPALYEEAIHRHEGRMSEGGAWVIHTAPYTGRLPQDKFFVEEPSSKDKIWWGKINRAFDAGKFERLRMRVINYLHGKDVFVQNCFAGADARYRIPIRVITERATHALFARTMFIPGDPSVLLPTDTPDFNVLHVPSFHADPVRDGTHSDAFIILDFASRMILIGGTAYAGEIKKSVFTVMNYLLPLRGVMPMHCSANYGKDPSDAAIFFGLSGTGKTTLSSVPERTLVGDDEHGWSDRGIFNFEGGCYAKVIRLSPEGEPEIYSTTRRFGTILENVVIDPRTRQIDLNDDSITENTRASYPISFIPNMTPGGVSLHPKNIIMLTCDAFGVLPPVAHLTSEQAMYHFLSGYTAKVAGTEAGIKEPQATFSACFGAPFMALPPSTYANLLGEKIARHKVDVWLMNTGWTGGPYGVGSRIKLSYTRALVKAILDGSLREVPRKTDPIFGLEIPTACPGVPAEMLWPRQSWKVPEAYDQKARELAQLFQKNFKESAPDAPEKIKQAGPKV